MLSLRNLSPNFRHVYRFKKEAAERALGQGEEGAMQETLGGPLCPEFVSIVLSTPIELLDFPKIVRRVVAMAIQERLDVLGR